MVDNQTIDVLCIQPSQFYISQEKLDAVEAWFAPDRLSAFEPIPIKRLDGELVCTDGHTRCVAALRHGVRFIPFVWDEDELDWEMYRRCVAACKERNVFSAQDLLSRIISAAEYEVKWNHWCDIMQAQVEHERKQSLCEENPAR